MYLKLEIQSFNLIHLVLTGIIKRRNRGKNSEKNSKSSKFANQTQNKLNSQTKNIGPTIDHKPQKSSTLPYFDDTLGLEAYLQRAPYNSSEPTHVFLHCLDHGP